MPDRAPDARPPRGRHTSEDANADPSVAASAGPRAGNLRVRAALPSPRRLELGGGLVVAGLVTVALMSAAIPAGSALPAEDRPEVTGPADTAPVDRTPDTAPPPSPAAGPPITLAFGGDVHAERGAGVAVRAGLPSVREVLSRADVAMLNVETAVTERGSAADKTFAFRAPVSTLTTLKEAGVDVVSLANNHGLDYGLDGLHDTLAASHATGLPLVGMGMDEDQAYAPWVTTVRGQRIAVLAATQVLDGNLADAWTAGVGKPGMASAKREDRLLDEVRRAAEQAETVVVYLHWGRERDPCPLPVQQDLARQLVDAGADVIVGTHAHVLLGSGYLDGAYVDYGLGNFAFNARSDEARRTGVLTVTVQDGSVRAARWTPAVVRNGAPQLLEGDEAERAVQDKRDRRSCTGLSLAG